jgi:hypothetical protein
MKEIVLKVVGLLTAGLLLAAAVSIPLGWLTAALWNSIDFLEGIGHLSWWDGIKLMWLCALLFKPTVSTSS